MLIDRLSLCIYT